MSIYSGFPNREQETNYNESVFKLLKLFEYRLVKQIQGGNNHIVHNSEQIDEIRFFKHLLKMHKKLCYLESFKHLKPLFSQAIQVAVTTIRSERSFSSISPLKDNDNTTSSIVRRSSSLLIEIVCY